MTTEFRLCEHDFHCRSGRVNSDRKFITLVLLVACMGWSKYHRSRLIHLSSAVANSRADKPLTVNTLTFSHDLGQVH